LQSGFNYVVNVTTKANQQSKSNNMGNDIEQIRRDISLVATAQSFGVDLKKDGDEWAGCCPFHSEKTASFTVFNGRNGAEMMHCFGCGAKGDVLDFVQMIKGVKLPDAIEILTGRKAAGHNVRPRQIETVDPYKGIIPVDPAGEIKVGQTVRVYNPKRAGTDRAWGKLVPSLVHPYRKADGSLMGYVLRREMQGGGKETPMIRFVELPDGTKCWSRFPFEKPRMLYGLDRIADKKQVIVVEGEKCRDAMEAATGRACVSWPGGTQGVKYVDWSPLAGRNVVIWPDNDDPGMKVSDEIAAILTKLDCRVRVCEVVAVI